MSDKQDFGVIAMDYIISCANKGKPLYNIDDGLARFIPERNQYRFPSKGRLKRDLFLEFSGVLGGEDGDYNKLANAVKLAVPHIDTAGDCPQFFIDDLQLAGVAPYAVPLRNGTFLAGMYVNPPAIRGAQIDVSLADCFVRPISSIFSTATRSYSFNADATCPHWQTWLEQMLPPEPIQLLQEWFGLCCVYDMGFERFMVWPGPPRTGKSTAKNVLERLLGEHQVANVGVDRMGTNFGGEEMIGKLLNVSPDVGYLSGVAEGHIKAFVSGDRSSFDRKYEKAVSVRPSARLLMIMNEWFNIRDRSGALIDRMLVIRFERRVPRTKRNRHLQYELCQELPGIFNWSMQGLRRLIQQGFTETKQMKREIRELTLTTNPVLRFCKEMLEVAPDESLTKEAIYNAYSRWAEGRKIKFIDDDSVFFREFKRIFPTAKATKPMSRGERVPSYRGVRFYNANRQSHLNRMYNTPQHREEVIKEADKPVAPRAPKDPLKMTPKQYEDRKRMLQLTREREKEAERAAEEIPEEELKELMEKLTD